MYSLILGLCYPGRAQCLCCLPVAKVGTLAWEARRTSSPAYPDGTLAVRVKPQGLRRQGQFESRAIGRMSSVQRDRHRRIVAGLYPCLYKNPQLADSIDSWDLPLEYAPGPPGCNTPSGSSSGIVFPPPVTICAEPATAFHTLTGSRICFPDRKSTRLNSSHANISYAVFCLKKKNTKQQKRWQDRQRTTRDMCTA